LIIFQVRLQPRSLVSRFLSYCMQLFTTFASTCLDGGSREVLIPWPSSKLPLSIAMGLFAANRSPVCVVVVAQSPTPCPCAVETVVKFHDVGSFKRIIPFPPLGTTDPSHLQTAVSWQFIGVAVTSDLTCHFKTTIEHD